MMPAMAPLAPSVGTGLPSIAASCTTGRNNAAGKVKHQVAARAKRIFNMRAEHPQKPHIAD